MLENISTVSVVVSAILAVAVGSVWYSPLCFGRILSKTTGHIFDDTEESRRVLLKHVFLMVLVQVLFLIFVSAFILQSSPEPIALMRIGVSLAGLVIATVLTVMVVEKRPLSDVLVHAGYLVVILFGGLTVISKWPW